MRKLLWDNAVRYYRRYPMKPFPTKAASAAAPADKVLAVLGAPNAFHAKIMEANGVEACFVGTSITGGNYTGLPDLGILSLTECVEFRQMDCAQREYSRHPGRRHWSRRHYGGTPPRARMHRGGPCRIAARRSAPRTKAPYDVGGISIVSRDEAVTRYRVAVDAKNEIDPDFVIMAQCYARNAVNGGMAETLKSLRLYKKEGGADWVQFEAPHSIDEIKRARKAVKGPFSAMKGQLPRALTIAEQKALGLNAAWYTFSPTRC